MQRILILETTCDETAAALVTDSLEVLASVVASQDELHQRFGGVVPEIASRAHVERILPVIDETLRRANLDVGDLDAVAVANTPGLAGSLLVGLSAAKALALALGVPLLAVNHLQAHIYACRLAARRDVFPCIGLIVSGGHTSLYRCAAPLDFELLGSTIDDAAGEAFDKVASLLGLPFPGGPAIERAARGGSPRAFDLPRPMLDAKGLDFSFSGLKTAVRYRLQPPGTAVHNPLNEQTVADLAASFQEAVVDCLAAKTMRAMDDTGLDVLCVGGGVAANTRLRQRFTEECASRAIELIIPPLRLCTDNAVMGAIAVERLQAGVVEPLSLDVFPGLVRKNGAPETRKPRERFPGAS
jgi:N6-L-threonylcarbamoyladenine synthase